jgi:hypothetical protein
MNGSCRCGTPIRFASEHLGCVECGAACCPSCAYLLESASYCPGCAESILELPWAARVRPGGAMAPSL